MRRFILTMLAVVTVSLSSVAAEDKYVINDNAIENAFSNAQEITLD